ncbi:hypothetical protein PIB30_093784 [Stylosanthes scabra]|uniref:Ubiquitin-like protease family profile domain-containing protein n=1 Tax=Stylosanthes scabra TaxID=79078 RepID=A0ABU6XXS3_9FABA|nr:hypothetical protein [Stylosanthes scabra]
MCYILNKEQNERFEKFVYCVPPEIMVRMFEKHNQSWMDTKNNRPHAIASLVNHEEYMVYLDKKKLLTHRFIFAPILFSEHWWLYVMDIEKREFFVLDSKNIVSPSDERSSLNRFAVGSCSLLPRYVNIPGQPNETDCGVFVMKWMELIDPTGLAASCEANRGYNIDNWGEPKLEEFRKELVAKIILSKDNEKRLETIRILNDMRNIRPTAVLRSPYVQVSSADLYTK